MVAMRMRSTVNSSLMLLQSRTSRGFFPDDHVKGVDNVELGAIDDLISTTSHVRSNPLARLAWVSTNSAGVGAICVGRIRVWNDGNTM